MKEISHRLGYAQVSTFTTAFSRHYGCPPADFRKSRMTRHFIRLGE
ncbi:MAG: helix-turn-helix domain-containing protein [Magnetospirillum sp.]|nr:helix-turn-helix domain-containing protein [Magnetospirillum sp.]